MGRKRKAPTKVLSIRMQEAEYRRMKEIARKTGKSISQIWREIAIQCKR